MTIPERTGAVRISGQPVPAAREVMAAYDQAVGHPGPWLSGSLAIWMPRLRAAADPPAGLPEPFAREMAGDWRGAAAAWDQLARPYDAAVVRLGSPDEAALREALKTLDDLGARANAAAVRRRMKELGMRVSDHIYQVQEGS